MKKFSQIALFSLFFVFTYFAWENFNLDPDVLGVSTVQSPLGEIQLPPQAADRAVVALGNAIDVQTGQEVQGYAIIDRADHPAKGGNGGDKGGGKPEKEPTSSCYGFISSGMKWRNAEPYYVNPANVDGLSSEFIQNTMILGANKWESASGTDIFGPLTMTNETLVADLNQTDGKNEVYFAPIDEPGVIGVTIVWGYFSGPPKQREIVEWDQVYDDFDFEWTQDAEVETNKMDFESIATHELGHTIGLADLYSTDCTRETMFGYGAEGQTFQRDLHLGDILGARELYK